MRKLAIALMLSMAALSAKAQDYSSLSLDTRPEVGPGEPINANAVYSPVNADDAAASYTWSITPCTETGVVNGEALFSENYRGTPDGNFEFPGSKDYQHGQFYLVEIQVATVSGHMGASQNRIVNATQQFGIAGDASVTVAPGSGVGSTTHTIQMGGDIYKILVTTSGGSFVNNFQMSKGGNALSPGASFVCPTSEQMSFSFFIPANVTPCQSETFTLTIWDLLLGQVVSTFNYTVECKGAEKQTVVNLYSGMYYKADDNHIHRLSWNGSSWNYQAITPSGGWGSVQVDGWLCGSYFVDRVFFRGKDAKIYALTLGGSVWNLAQIGTISNVKSDLQFRDNNQLLYIGTDQLIHSVTYANGAWTHSQITSGYTAKGGLAYEDLNDGNIYYRDQNNDLFGLWLNGSFVWTLVPILTNGTCNGDMLYDSPMKRVFFRGTDGYIHCETWTPSTSWVYDAMPSPNSHVQSANCLTHIQGTNNIVFKGTNNKAYTCTKQPNGTWHTDWLDGNYSSVAGDMLCDWTHVWFVSSGKQLSNYFWNGSSFLVSALNNSAPANTVGCSSFYRFANPQATEVNIGTAFDVYPNPSNGAFQVSLSSDAVNAQAELFNIMGERVDAFSFSGSSYIYSPAVTLAPGVYLLRVTNNGNTDMKQLVIQ